MDVNAAAVAPRSAATGVRRMIHGHTHRPGMHDIGWMGLPAQRIVLGAWYEQGSYLSCERGATGCTNCRAGGALAGSPSGG